MDLKDTYNLIAEDWHTDHGSDRWWVEGTDALIALLTPGATVLDVGCGSGTKSKYLYERGCTVIGIDISDKLLAIAKREAPHADFLEMDMRDAAALGRTVDAVFAQASLLHIPKQEAAQVVTQLVSVLKDDGYLYIAVKGLREGKPEEEMKEEDDYGYTYSRFFSYYTMEELESYLRALHLDVVFTDTTRLNNTDWLQIIGHKQRMPSEHPQV